jgi:hypothetical protein
MKTTLEDLWAENEQNLVETLSVTFDQAKRDEAFANFKVMADILLEVEKVSPERQERFIKGVLRGRRWLKVKLLARRLLMLSARMKLPRSRKLPVINLSGFHLEKPDKQPWMTLAPKSEQENAALQKALDMPAVVKRFTVRLHQHRAKVARYDENSVEHFSTLERIGITANGNFVVVQNEVCRALYRNFDGGWIAHICPPQNYKELERAFDVEQARIRKEIKEL